MTTPCWLPASRILCPACGVCRLACGHRVQQALLQDGSLAQRLQVRPAGVCRLPLEDPVTSQGASRTSVTPRPLLEAAAHVCNTSPSMRVHRVHPCSGSGLTLSCLHASKTPGPRLTAKDTQRLAPWDGQGISSVSCDCQRDSGQRLHWRDSGAQPVGSVLTSMTSAAPSGILKQSQACPTSVRQLSAPTSPSRVPWQRRRCLRRQMGQTQHHLPGSTGPFWEGF